MGTSWAETCFRDDVIFHKRTGAFAFCAVAASKNSSRALLRLHSRTAVELHGGGVGMGYSQHSGVVIVCDGSDAAAKRIERVLFNDPATGVMRHADAGYDIAVATAKKQGLKLPMVK